MFSCIHLYGSISTQKLAGASFGCSTFHTSQGSLQSRVACNVDSWASPHNSHLGVSLMVPSHSRLIDHEQQPITSETLPICNGNSLVDGHKFDCNMQRLSRRSATTMRSLQISVVKINFSSSSRLAVSGSTSNLNNS